MLKTKKKKKKITHTHTKPQQQFLDNSFGSLRMNCKTFWKCSDNVSDVRAR